MSSRSARIVLVLFALSASMAQLIEVGHDLLHRINNPFHHHAVRTFKNIPNHSLADHHFPKMKFAHEMDEPATPSSFIVLAFGFVQPIKTFQFSTDLSSLSHHTPYLQRDYWFFLSPPVPPPTAHA
jgi:hypothetical protein